MAISAVWIEEGCVLCLQCEEVCPEVFGMGEDTAYVKADVTFEEYEDRIKEAAEECPVDVIKFDEE